jgi:hypothetical protein
VPEIARRGICQGPRISLHTHPIPVTIGIDYRAGGGSD